MTLTDQQVATLTEFDFLVYVDKSGSMGTADMPGGRTRWEAMAETVEAFARDVSKFDSDGIDLILFGNGVRVFNGADADKVHSVFTDNGPRGSTPLAEALVQGLALGKGKDKKQFHLVFTDGEPDSRDAVVNAIKTQANSQATDDACTILFVQVGKDPGATAFLKMLDDGLQAKGAKFDIVNTQSMDEANAFASTAELVFHAIDN